MHAVGIIFGVKRRFHRGTDIDVADIFAGGGKIFDLVIVIIQMFGDTETDAELTFGGAGKAFFDLRIVITPGGGEDPDRNIAVFGTDGGDLLQTQLPCQHHPLCAQIIPGLGAFVIGDGLLCGYMSLTTRRVFSGQGKGTEICQNQCIYTGS